MNLDLLFKSYSHEEKFTKIYQRWDFSKVLPVPLFDFVCPICGSDRIKLGEWIFFRKKSSNGTPYRCDVRFKCTECSFVPIFGVVVELKIFNKLDHYKHAFTWYEGLEILKGQKKVTDFKPEFAGK